MELSPDWLTGSRWSSISEAEAPHQSGRMNHVLFGRDGLGEVPQLEGVVLRDRDQTRLNGVEGQRTHAIKVAPQRVLGIPGLPKGRVFTGRQLRTENLVREGQRTS